ncbi:MAG TPA: sugar O-acetyltransferase [Candidatus Omnitrophica bacterium]|nr:sugar O-acetyltransferase [Candidatus Omnitrophota bacterium]
MREYEKMIAGEMYNAMDPELIEMRLRARKLLTQINQSVEDIRTGPRFELVKDLLGAVGKNVWLQPPFFCDYGKNITFGDSVFLNFNCVILDVAKVTVGSFVFMAPNVQIYTAGHPLDWQERRKVEFGKPITIGDDVWIGGNAVICPGVTIGSKSVIGAGAVVTKDVPNGVVVAGNPARVLKQLQ